MGLFRYRLIGGVYFVLWLIGSSHGQEPRALIEVQSEVDTAMITIGDQIHYTLTIDHVSGMRIEQPGPGVNLGQFEIKDYKISDPEEYDNRRILRYEYVISVFDTGNFTIPPFPVAYFPEDSAGAYKIIEASPIDIHVLSVINDEQRELRDIKAPLWIPFDYKVIIVAVLILILLGVGGYFGYQFYRRRKEQGYLFKPSIPPRPAHEIALDELNALIARDYLAMGNFKLFYSEISEIIRRYIEGRFFIPALEETSREILQEMDKQEIEQQLKDLLRDFLALSDLVKFAKYIPAEPENQNAPVWARKFIEETKIVFEMTESESQEAVLEAS